MDSRSSSGGPELKRLPARQGGGNYSPFLLAPLPSSLFTGSRSRSGRTVQDKVTNEDNAIRVARARSHHWKGAELKRLRGKEAEIRRQQQDFRQKLAWIMAKRARWVACDARVGGDVMLGGWHVMLGGLGCDARWVDVMLGGWHVMLGGWDVMLGGWDVMLGWVDVMLGGGMVMLGGWHVMLGGWDVMLGGWDVMLGGWDVMLGGWDVMLGGWDGDARWWHVMLGGWDVMLGGWHVMLGGWDVMLGGWHVMLGGWDVMLGGWDVMLGGWDLGQGVQGWAVPPGMGSPSRYGQSLQVWAIPASMGNFCRYGAIIAGMGKRVG
ncbi:unnamed protein product [Closterium sp. NIES-65]|nr:unnamed protein product [Closterium sp. NIES-65]